MASKLPFVILLIILVDASRSLELKAKAYEDLTISISDNVPSQYCKTILANLETTLTSASQYLFSALDSRAYLRSATVILPASWPDSCASTPVTSASGDTPDVTVLPQGPARGHIWTQQSLGCGQPGDQIYLAFEKLRARDDTLARLFVKEFAKYRYGVFDEQGYSNDPIYPMCYYDDQTKKAKLTGCSDFPIDDNGICSGSNVDYNVTKMVNSNARSSIMFAAQAPSVSMFCENGNHDRFAPTKHNLICQQRSTIDVILSHPDFAYNQIDSEVQKSQIVDTTPKVTYKKQMLTRYVLVIENTKDMLQRESWSFLRFAIRKWAVHDLPENTEVGVVLTNETGSQKILNIVSLKGVNDNRVQNRGDVVASIIPYTPGESTQSPCLHCAIKTAVDMLNDRTRIQGPANSVILVIATGSDTTNQTFGVINEAKKNKIRIASVNYPNIIRQDSLDFLAKETGGVSFTVFEQKLNVGTSLLSTYFQLSNVLYNVVQRFYSGNSADLPIEIHRREIKDDGRSSVSGSFMLDSTFGEPARFMLYTHNSESPLIKGMKLISPSHQIFSSRSDNMLNYKIITVISNISETGTWTYTIEPYAGNPQPHFLQVMATPRSVSAPVVRAKFWTHRNQPGSPLVLLAEVKRGDIPVLGAKVEVLVTKTNGSVMYSERFDLLDTGSGDPDITKGDGVYSRYFSPASGGPGIYMFEVLVTDNGNTAYSSHDPSNYNYEKPCCGNVVPSEKVQPLAPFQRILPPITLEITSEDIIDASQMTVGRIGDLKAELIPDDLKVRLTWTAPDMGGQMVARYEVKYAYSVQDIADYFDSSAVIWDNGTPFPLSPGSETTFTLDLSQDKNLLDRPLYFAIRAFSHANNLNLGTISNWVRVFMASPPPPPTAPPTYTSNEHSSWPFPSGPSTADSPNPSISRSGAYGLELILPVAFGFILLIVLLVVYCYFCVVKRRAHGDHKKSPKNSNGAKNVRLNSNITIVPNSPVHEPQTYTVDAPDPHTVGVPINNYGYEDETKKRFSLVQQQEQQLIEELKQQHQQQQQQQQQQQRDHMNTPNNNYSGLSIISNTTLQRNGHTLSPYNSWSASQLLHEHERRHSPLQDEQLNPEMMMGDQISLNVDHMSLSGHNTLPEHYGHPPPVPPLPTYASNGYPLNYQIYGVHQQQQQQPQQLAPGHGIYQSMQRTEQVPYGQSLQGSMSSVNSGDKKRRNVTMV